MANRYLLDTNIVIYTLGSLKSAIGYINKVTLSGGEFYFSTITEAEVFSKPLDKEIEQAFNEFFQLET